MDYWLFQRLHPAPPPSCTLCPVDLLLRPVCSSPDCQSDPSHLPCLSLPSTSALVEALEIENRLGCVGKRGKRGSARSIFVCYLSHYLHCSSTASAALSLEEMAPSVVASALCRSRHFPLMSAFEMAILCVILVKWSTLLSAGTRSFLTEHTPAVETPSSFFFNF